MPATLLKMNSFTHFSRILLKLVVILKLVVMISRNISYLLAASEIIVSYILIVKKTKKIVNLSQKYVAENKKFLSENLKAKAKLKNMKSQECYGKFSDKKSLYIYLFICLFIYLCIYLFLFYLYIFFG